MNVKELRDEAEGISKQNGLKSGKLGTKSPLEMKFRGWTPLEPDGIQKTTGLLSVPGPSSLAMTQEVYIGPGIEGPR